MNALAGALDNSYTRCGFHYRNSKVRTFFDQVNSHTYCEQGEVVKDPFRQGIGSAVQWYDSLQSLLGEQVKKALKTADEIVTTIKTTNAGPPPPLDPLPFSVHASSGHAFPSSTDGQAPPTSPSNALPSTLTARAECARILQHALA